MVVQGAFRLKKNAITFDVISNFVQFWSKKMIHLAYASVGHIETMKYMLSSHLTNTD